jgi:hypothetical protein
VSGRLTLLLAASSESAKFFRGMSFLLILWDFAGAFWTYWLGGALASMPGDGVLIVESSSVCSEAGSVSGRAEFGSVSGRAEFGSPVFILSEVRAQARNERVGAR